MKKQHFYLVAGSVMFRDPEVADENQVGSIMLNATIRCETKDVQAHYIGKAQQTLQMLMFQKLEDPNLQVVDVVIVNFTYLGLMTEEFFMAPPKGTVLAPTGPVSDDPLLN